MEQLQNEISAYETQLAQVQFAISASPDGPDKDNLITLESDIKELIKLTKDSLEQLAPEAKKPEDALDAEYDLFKSELATLDDSAGETSKSSIPIDTMNTALEDLQNDLKSLEGMKCQAPYKYQWANDASYHNALVFHVDRTHEISQSEDIKVRVMFTNPTHKEMLPCPFYLEGDCKFNDEKCRFSHGELVSLNSLKEYREPNFSELTQGSKVLAKQEDNLWHRGIITLIDGVMCKIKFEMNSKEEEMHLQNVLPLENFDSSDSDSDSDDSSDEEDFRNILKAEEDEMVRRVLSAPPSSALGEWEKHTKGFGSKIMAKMGYIHGCGLGSKGDGRVEPVSAVILPAGKSLDHCMMLKENAGGDQDLFKAERKIKKLQRKHEIMLEKAYEREKEKTNVFTFLNKKLGQAQLESKNDCKNVNVQKNLKNETTRKLNVTSLQLTEEMRKTEKEIKSLNQSLARHSSDSQVSAVLKEKLCDKQAKLSQLQASERKIMNEQEQRRDRKKLSIF